MNSHTPRAVAAVAAGGVLGALARYGIGVAWPHHNGGFPWATWAINVSGSFLIGALLTALSRWWPDRLYPRPFLATGILGGYTTFSTSIVDLQHTSPTVAILYLFATVTGALLAVWAGSGLAAIGEDREVTTPSRQEATP